MKVITMLFGRYEIEFPIETYSNKTLYKAVDFNTRTDVIITREGPLTILQRGPWLNHYLKAKKLEILGVHRVLDARIGKVDKESFGFVVQTCSSYERLSKEKERTNYTPHATRVLILELLSIIIKLQDVSPPFIHTNIHPHVILRDQKTQKLFITDFSELIELKHENRNGSPRKDLPIPQYKSVNQFKIFANFYCYWLIFNRTFKN